MYGQAGVCIDTNVLDCRNTPTKAGFCRGASNIKCCPSGLHHVKTTTKVSSNTPTPSPPGKDSCMYGQAGVCIDTNEYGCRDTPTKAGFCRGASNIKCCPSGVRDAKTTTKVSSNMPTPSPPGKDSCMYGQAGVCIDTNEYGCRDTPTKAGFCRGASNIKCCPSGVRNAKTTTKASSNTPPPSPPIPWPQISTTARVAEATQNHNSHGSCLYGQTGTCIDTNKYECGSQVKRGFCPGTTATKCCPSSDAVAKVTPLRTPGPPGQLTKTSTRAFTATNTGLGGCLHGQAGVCINTWTHTCMGAYTKAGYCRGNMEIKCCPTRTASPLLTTTTERQTGGRFATTATPTQSFNDEQGHLCSGRAGICIDTDVYTCDGAKTLTGFCPGFRTIRCCPTSMASPRSAIVVSGNNDTRDASQTSGSDEELTGSHAVPCLRGQPGACIDTKAQLCPGARPLVGFCPGDSHLRCCPTVVGATTLKAFQPATLTLSCSADRTDIKFADTGASTYMALLLPDRYFAYEMNEANAGFNDDAVTGDEAVGPQSGSTVDAQLQEPGSSMFDCQFSRTSPQLGWTACVCERKRACVGGGCLEQNGFAFWVLGRCADCRCASNDPQSSNPHADVSSPDSIAQSARSSKVAVVLTIAAVILVLVVAVSVAALRNRTANHSASAKISIIMNRATPGAGAGAASGSGSGSGAGSGSSLESTPTPTNRITQRRACSRDEMRSVGWNTVASGSVAVNDVGSETMWMIPLEGVTLHAAKPGTLLLNRPRTLSVSCL